MRSDSSRPGDLYALVSGLHAKDAAMDVVLVSTLSKSCLLKSSSSSDYALRQAENNKFDKDLRNIEPLQFSATKRFIPLAMNQLGRRGSHFEAAIREHASLMIKRPSGCRLLQGPLVVPPTMALAKVFQHGEHVLLGRHRGNMLLKLSKQQRHTKVQQYLVQLLEA